MSSKSIPAIRLLNQRLTGAPLARPADVVGWFGAVQAQEYEHAKWALALRLAPAAAHAGIERAFEEGRILRTHVMRPTWHFVSAADILWMQELTAPRVHARMAPYNKQIGLTSKLFTRATAIFERSLRDRNYLTRQELADRLPAAGVTLGTRFAGIALAHVAMYAEVEGVICSGPRRGREFTYALVSERAPGAKRLERDEALAELATRYVRSHGPVTIRDFVWWSGLKTPDAKRGFEIARARREDVDGIAYWTLGPSPRSRASTGPLHLLPIYDEYLVAYRDRIAVPHVTPSAFSKAKAVVFQHAFVIDGQVAGTWRTSRKEAGVRVDVTPLSRITRTERQWLDAAIARYRAFLD